MLGVTRSGGSANSDGTRPDRPEAGTRGSSTPPPRPSSTPPRPSRASGSSDGFPIELWMTAALLLGLATVGLLTTVLGRGLPTPAAALSKRRGRRAHGATAKASTLLCAFCQSSHVAVNSREGVYRCARCGFGGTLTGADAPGLAKMEAHSHEGSARKT